MELRHLRYFLAVAEERHITRAAQRLGMRQPPLSQQIRALEMELGLALFHRNPRGVELTPAGESLLRDARSILAAVERGTAAAQRAARGQSGRLALGFTTSAILHPLVPQIIRAFRASYAGVELHLSEDNAATLTQAVFDREMDVALLRAPVARPPEIAFSELAHEELLVALPVGHRLLGRRGRAGLQLLDLAEERFILVRRPGGIGIYENVVLACRGAGFEPLIAAEVPRMLSAVNLVAAGVGISFVPASMRKVGLQQVNYRRLLTSPPLTAPLTLAWRAGNEDPILANFIAVTRSKAAG